MEDYLAILLICIYFLIVIFFVFLPLKNKFRVDTLNRVFFFDGKAYNFSNIKSINVKISSNRIRFGDDICGSAYATVRNGSNLSEAFDFEMLLNDGTIVCKKLRCGEGYYLSNLPKLKEYIPLVGDYEQIMKISKSNHNNNTIAMWLIIGFIVICSLICLLPLFIIVSGYIFR